MKSTSIKRIILILLAIIIILTSVYFIVGNYFYNFAINSKSKKVFADDNDSQIRDSALNHRKDRELEKDKIFSKNQIPVEASVTAYKPKLKLIADIYEQENTTDKWAIIVHGYNGNSGQMIRWIRNFYENGYNILTPDLRGHGRSEGEYIEMGWDDRKDMLLWIDYIIESAPNAEIVLLGVSMGAATVMNTAGEDLPSNVKVIIEDCGYSSTSEVLEHQLNKMFGLHKFPVLYAANTVTKIRAGYDFFNSSSLKQVAKSTTPMLFIHGDQDDFVPYKMLEPLYEAANVEKEKLVIEGAGHSTACMVDSETYWSNVWEFVNKYINI
jgi:hypothetical protein